jgi:flagellar FliL protein
VAAEGVAAAAGAKAPAKGKSKGKLPLIGGVVLLLAAGGGGMYWWNGRHAGEPAVEAKEIPPSARGLVSFEPFVANLADPGGTRFVRTTIQLVVADPLQATEVGETPVLLMQARAVILELLTTQTADVLVTQEGKAALRKAIAEQVTAALHEIEVVDVLFSDFVVQF